jgi:protein lifeguard
MAIWGPDCAWCVFLCPYTDDSYLITATVMTGIVGMFIPFNSTMDLIYAIGGSLLFSGYIVYDTYMINQRLSPDEFIVGAISLYLEYVSYALYVNG